MSSYLTFPRHLLLLLRQALSVLESLVLPGTDQLDVKDKAAVSVHTEKNGTCLNTPMRQVDF
jgi:hypothetical protein